MSKRLSSQAAKRSSGFESIIQAHKGPDGAGKSAAPTAVDTGIKGKSANPDYTKLTAYIRRDTHKSVKRRLLEEGREISELVEELFGRWLHTGAG